ncbi:peptide ABC transporter substrate-binding protein [Reyranella soli]|uniref:Diguanylate phosphodiesterase n=1 Tax=Reyranella soli TaxID=1230389 RepID=A0A512N5Z7_9HYPH|nr:peptide ABC transporter substrate-binding protein [Reyranella soli]GEP54406.1 diguanylate phosphodiesterase [Reyranella soli]
MIRRILFVLLALAALASPARAKDELVIGMTQSPGTWNPLISSMLAKSLISNMTSRPLTAWNADWKLVCLVCTELPTIENGKARVIDLPDDGKGGGKKGMEVDLELRDLKWGDGTPVTAKDVAFTLEVGRHPLSGVASAEFFKRVIKFDAKDDRRFTMTIDRVTFDYNSMGLLLLPAHIEKPIFEANPAEYRNKTAFDTNSTNPGLFFGPFRIVEIVPGNRIVLEQNPTWTGEKPYFKRIVVKIIENTAALEANLLSGNVDYVFGELGLSLDQVLAFEKRHKDKYDFIYKPALIYEHIDTMLDNKLLEDRRVRQAILSAIDRKAISEKLFEGKNPIADGPISPLDPMFTPNTKHYAYDPAAARKLLDEAGFSDIKNGVRHNAKGERLSLEITTTAGNRVRELVTQVIQSQLRQVGIELRIKAEPMRVFSEALNRRQFSALAMYAWVQSPEGVPRTLLYSTEIPTAENAWSGQNYPGYRNPAMDAALDGAERELNFDKRRALFADIQRIHAEDLPVLPMFFRVDPFVIPKQLKGVVPTGHINSSTLWIEQWRWEN